MKGINEFAKSNPLTTAIIAVVAIAAIDNIVVNICKTISYKARAKAIVDIGTADDIETTEIINQED